MRAQRSAATALPVRVLGPGGVIRIMSMDQAVTERPTSGASPAELTSQLRQTRTRTHQLTDELSSEQLMGAKLESSTQCSGRSVTSAGFTNIGRSATATAGRH